MADKIQDYYRTLDLEVTASRDEVKQAWLEFQKFYHPDRYQHDQKLMRSGQEKLKKINAAYDSLKRHFASIDSRQPQAKPTPATPSTKSEPPPSAKQRESTSSEDCFAMTCSHCLNKINFLKKLEGKSGKCPKCGGIVKMCRDTKEENSTNPEPKSSTYKNKNVGGVKELVLILVGVLAVFCYVAYKSGVRW